MSKIRLTHVAALAQLPFPPCVARGWLGVTSLSNWYGPSNSGKTFLLLHLAMSIATGREFHDDVPTKSGAVFYCACEGRMHLKARVLAWAKHHDIDLEKVPVYVIDPIKLGEGDAAAELAAAILSEMSKLGELKPRLIVLDTVARTMQGDENASKDMKRYVDAADELRLKTGAHVALVHHTGHKATDRARGSSVLVAAVDTEIQVTRDDDLVVAEATKQRDLPLGKRLVFEMRPAEDVGKDDDGAPVTSVYLTPSAREPRSSDGDKAHDKALAVLRELQARGRNPNDGRIAGAPRWWHIARVDDWKVACKAKPISTGKGPAQRKAFREAVKKLQESEKVKLSTDGIWATAEYASGGYDEGEPLPEDPGGDVF